MTTQQPEALRLANEFDAEFAQWRISNHTGRKAAAELRRLHSENETLQAGYAAARLEIESLQARMKTMTKDHADELMVAHLDGRMRAAQPAGAQQAPAQAAPQQEAQEPCPTCTSLARTVMLDQVSFDRKPDCYGIRLITDDEGIEEWEDVRTSPDVAREEANDMMATGRGEIYEVVPLWTTPQPSPTPQADSQPAPAGADRHGLPPLPDPDLRDVGTTPGGIKEFLRGYATEYAKAAIAARAQADSVREDAARYRWLRHGDNDEKVLKTYTSRPSKPGEPTMFLPRNDELDRLIDAARAAQEGRCKHCIDRHDGIYGSWAAPCPYHDDDGNPRIDAARAAQEGKSHG